MEKEIKFSVEDGKLIVEKGTGKNVTYNYVDGDTVCGTLHVLEERLKSSGLGKNDIEIIRRETKNDPRIVIV